MVWKWVRPKITGASGSQWGVEGGDSAFVITIIQHLTFLQFQKNSLIWFPKAVTGIMNSQ